MKDIWKNYRKFSFTLKIFLRFQIKVIIPIRSHLISFSCTRLNKFLAYKFKFLILQPVLEILIGFQACYLHMIAPSRDARRGRWKLPPSPPRETEKIVVEKWCYFPELYKMTKVREDGIENGEKVNFPLRFLYINFKIFYKNFNPVGF